MRHTNSWQVIGTGVILFCIVGAAHRTASAEGPQRMSIVHAAQSGGAPTAKHFTQPLRPITDGTAGRSRTVLSAPGRAIRSGESIRPNRGSWQAVRQNSAKKRSWEIVPQGAASESGGTWVIVPKGSDAATSGTKSPGFGKTPPTKGFPEPSSNGPQRTTASSLRVRAPEANPSNSTRVRAPEAPNATPGPAANPAPGPQNPDKEPGVPQPALFDWVAAAGAIAGMASGMKSPGDAGYGDTCYNDLGYGEAGSSYEEYDDPSDSTSYEADADAYPANTAGDGVPSNPLPAARMQIALVNPTENQVSLQFLLDGQPQTLEAGTRFDFTVTSPVQIKFDRGGQLGVGRYRLTENLYTFRPTDHGWELYRSPYVAPAQQ